MEGNEVGTAYVGVEFQQQQISGALGGLQSKLTGELGAFGKPLGALLGAGMKAGIAGAVAGTAVLVGRELYKIGAEFDQMHDTIAESTGASGKTLDGLYASAKRVGDRVDVSFEQVGVALSRLHQRTGATGTALEKLTQQQVELAKMTGEDLAGTIDASSKAFSNWGITVGQQSGKLDELFRASQQTGAHVGDLAAGLARYGPLLRGFGLNFEQAAALLGSFDQAGVNTGAAMAGLKRDLSTLAKAGKEPVAALHEQVDAIKNAKTAADATGIAVKAFGTRAGPDLAAAIRSGKLGFDDLAASIKNGHETITGAEKDSRDFAENWTVFSNNLKTLVEPAASAVFGAIGKGMGELAQQMPAIEAALGPTFQQIGVTLQQLMQIVRELGPVWQVAFQIITNTVQAAVGLVRAQLEILQGILRLVAALLRGDWSAAWQAALQIVHGFVDGFKAQLQLMTAALRALIAPFEAGARALMQGFVNGIRSAYGAVTGALAALRNVATSALASAASWLVSAGAAIVHGLVSGIRETIDTVGAAIGRAKAAVVNACAGAGKWLYAVGQEVVQGLIDGITSKAEAAASAIASVASKVIGAAKGLAGFITRSPSRVFYAIGVDVVQGLANGIEQNGSKAAQAMARVAAQTVTAAQSTLAGAADRLGSILTTAFEARQGQLQTAAGKQLATLQAAHDEAQRQQALADAQTQQAQAQTDDEKKSAAQAVADAQYQIQVAALQKQADAEQTALDARKQLRAQAFQDQLSGLETQIESGKLTGAQAKAKTQAFMQRFGLDFGQMGDLLGSSFTTALQNATTSVDTLADALRKKIQAAIKLLQDLQDANAKVAAGGGSTSGARSASAAAAAPVEAQPMALAAGMLGAPAAAGAGGGGLAGRPPSPLAQLTRSLSQLQPGAATLDGLEVNVYIGDTELRGLVRTEVVASDQQTARALLAGGRGIR